MEYNNFVNIHARSASFYFALLFYILISNNNHFLTFMHMHKSDYFVLLEILSLFRKEYCALLLSHQS